MSNFDRVTETALDNAYKAVSNTDTLERIQDSQPENAQRRALIEKARIALLDGIALLNELQKL